MSDDVMPCEHGSYGLCPQCVREERDRLRAELAEARRLLDEARKQEPDEWRCVSPGGTTTRRLQRPAMEEHKAQGWTCKPLYAAPVPAQPELGMPVWRELWTGSGSNGNGDSMRRGSHIYAYETHLKTHGDHVVWLGESPEAHEAAAKICREHNATMALVSHPDPSVIGHLGCHPVPAQPAVQTYSGPCMCARDHCQNRTSMPHPTWKCRKESQTAVNMQGGYCCQCGHELCDDCAPLHPHPTVPDDVAKDAARYRWLRDGNVTGKLSVGEMTEISDEGWERVTWLYDEELDAEIDAAMLSATDTEGRKDE